MCHRLLALALLWGVSAKDATPSFGIQMDAGSTGTRLYIYDWKPRESDVDVGGGAEPLAHDTSKPKPNQIAFSIKVNPGLSSFGTDEDLMPAEAGSSLEPLFAFARSTLEASGCDATCQATVPVFLGATAGMRMLDVNVAEDIMKSVQGYIRESTGFRFDDNAWARIISGEEEGGFGWLAVNWLLGSWQAGATPGNSVGALDLGGASTQMSFLPAESVLASYFDVSVNDLSKGIYTHSYLYFGRDQALELQAAALVAAAVDDAATVNPCFPTGSVDTSAQQLPGSSDVDACTASCAVILAAPPGEACLNADGTRCAVRGEYQPALRDSRFFGLSSFVYTWQFLNVSSTASLSVVSAAAAYVCGLDSDELIAYNAELPVPEDDAFLSGFCFSAVYAVQLLTAYGFPAEDTPLSVIAEVNGTEVGWAYGAMIDNANRLEWLVSAPKDVCKDVGGTVSVTTFYVAVGALATALLATVAVAVVVVRRKPDASRDLKAEPYYAMPDEA